MKENVLDEKGFVFTGVDGKPYLMRMYYGQPWIMYWHEYTKTWVNLRAVATIDVVMAFEQKMSDDDAKYYHDLHTEYLKSC